MTHSSDEQRNESVATAMTVIQSFKGMTAAYKEKCYRGMRMLNDPGSVASELKKKVLDKGLTGERAARYFFRSWMNACND